MKSKIAHHQSSENDLTQIQENSDFEKQLRNLVFSTKPACIIETGTYLGTGTTRIVASTLRHAGLNNTTFYSIECNPKHHLLASNNIESSGLSPYVSLLHGLSVPRKLLPDTTQIYNDTVDKIKNIDIFVDHEEDERVYLYHRETDFPNIPDDMLGYCFRDLKKQPDIIILDSAGHMGYLEFNYVIKNLASSCYMVLDDILHIKHFDTYRHIKRDSRFKVLYVSEEKFGFCIVKFTPNINTQDKNINSLLYVRTDAIGDAVLSISMLQPIKEKFPQAFITVLCQEHISEIYETCPYCDNVITFNRKMMTHNEEYIFKFREMLNEKKFDICLNTIFSRDILSDLVSLSSNSGIRIAYQGDLANINKDDLVRNNSLYTNIIHGKGRHKNELERHRDFLKGIEIEVHKLMPQIWLTDEDYNFADSLLEKTTLKHKTMIALFAGAQSQIRRFELYGEALIKYCENHNSVVLALGNQSDYEINQHNLEALKVKCINLSKGLTLRQTAAIISRCNLAVGAETGLAHIACAVGTPNVILLGGGHFGRFMPYSPLTTTVSLPLSCYGCNWKCPYPEPYCITRIFPQTLAEAIEKSLSNSRSEKSHAFLQHPALWHPTQYMPRWSLPERFLDANSVKMEISAPKQG